MSARRRPAAPGRLVLGTLLGTVVVAAVGACTAAREPSPAPAPSTSPSAVGTTSEEPVTLRFAVYGQPAVLSAYRELAAAYMRDHPAVTVSVETSRTAAAAAARLDRAFAVGSAPDLFLAGETELPALVADRRVQPVDELLEQRGVQFGDSYQRLGLEAFAENASLQCMPNDVSPYVVFYNRRLLSPETVVAPGETPSTETPTTRERGWTWEQFTTAARQTTRGDVKGVYLPPRMTTLMPLVRSAREDVVDDASDPTTLTFASDGTRAALERILTVARDRRLTPTPRQLAGQDALSRFENGRLAMMVGTRELVPRLREKAGLRFDVYPLPAIAVPRTLAEMTGYCIAAPAAHIAAAADFLAFASGRDGSAIMAASGGVVPANLAALHSPAFLQPNRLPRDSVVFDEVIRDADPMPSAPGWPAVVARTRPLLDRLFYAPVVDLDTLLPRIDQASVPLLAPATPSGSPSDPVSPASPSTG